MASNELPKKRSLLLTLAEDMSDGLGTLGVALGVKQVTEAVLESAIGSFRLAEETYGGSKGIKKGQTTVRTVADSNAKSFIGQARKILATQYGEAWNEDWAMIPWVGPNANSTAVPSKQADRMELCKRLSNFFTTHADLQVNTTKIQVTAALALTRHNALKAARDTSNTGLVSKGQLRVSRDQTEAALRRLMRGLIDELAVLLPAEDPRWEEFGLTPPAADDLPDVPEPPVLTLAGPMKIFADWADAARAQHYRVFVQIVGVDAAFRFAVSVDDSDAMLEGFASGQTVRVQLTAVNGAGESLPGTFAELVIP